MPSYIGVNLGKRGLKRWRAQIIKMNTSIYLGTYATADEARDAYDDAAYTLRKWGPKAPVYNNPERWVNVVGHQPLNTSLKALATLREKYPDFEKTIPDAEMAKDGNAAVTAVNDAVNMLDKFTDAIRRNLDGLTRRIEELNTENEMMKEENRSLRRMIEGLRAGSASKEFFRPVEGDRMQPVGEVEAKLG